MKISEKTTVEQFREMIGVSVWIWKPPGYDKPIEKPQERHCYGIVVESANIVFQLSGPQTESHENVYKTEADAAIAYNAHLDSLRMEA